MNWSATSSQRRFALFAWGLLVYNIPVILWGAYVRISFSGDGCGANWPFCNGQVIPQQMKAPMAIEFAHRLMTGADSVAAIFLCFWAFRAFSRGHAVRRFATIFFVSLFVEAILGAGLVLFRYVAHDASAGRAVYLAAHLTNTLLLLGALAATAWSAGVKQRDFSWGNISTPFAGALAVSLAIGITGAIAALGDTLFPASSLAAGMRQDLSSTSNLLLRLRMFHPLVAILGSAYLIWLAVRLVKDVREPVHRAGIRVLVLILLQISAGVVNLALLAPVWMQLIHLALGDLLWIAVVLMTMEATSARNPGRIQQIPDLVSSSPGPQ
jgi:heme a synthase